MFLELQDNGDVEVTPEGKHLEEVKILFASDKSTNKVLYRQWLKYIYWVYKRNGTFQNVMLTEKKKEIVSRFFPDKKVDYFEDNKKVQDVIGVYLRTQYSHWELLFEHWKKDVDQYIQYLVSVPYFRKKKVKDGDKEHWEDVENIDEKLKAQKAIQDLVDTGQKMELKILKEKKEKSGRLEPLFDNG